jgi:RNA polymerase sigma-54 factor
VRTQGSEADVAALDLIPADIGLRQHLRSQINVLPLDERDHALACAIIESLDDDGYLRVELDELAATAGMSPPVEAAEMQIALKRVQALDPPGVGARSVAECLLLQLPQVEDAEVREVARAIVTDHLDRLAQHDVNGLAALLKRTPAQIEAACERIRHLSPRPGWNVEPTDDPVHHARRHRPQGARSLDGDAEPRRRAARQAEPGLRVDVPGASHRPAR